jgi:hypothetical protein
MLDPCSITTGNPFIDGPMSRFTFLNEDGETKVSYSFHNIYCPDVVQNFKDFLLGCGFLESTVIEAMYGVIEEYESLYPRKDSAKSSLAD